MNLPSGASRVLLLFLVGAAVVSASARPPLAETTRGILILTIAFVAAWTARSTLVLLAARRRIVTIDHSGPLHRLARSAGGAALLATACSSPLLLSPVDWSRLPIFTAAMVGVATGAALASRDRLTRRPRPSSTTAWLFADTALPAGLLAALIGVDVAFMRLHDTAIVQPGTVARHLAGTVFLYALLLGLGGMSKAFSEKSAGLVIVEDIAVRPPGPLLVGGLIGLALLFAVPPLMPPLSLPTVLVLKAAVGFCVGGGLSLLGALHGARLASRGGRPP